MEQDIQKSLAALRAGGIILYPTDTVWGIGCDATNEIAVNRILRLKMREDMKSLLVLLDDPCKIQNYVEIVQEIAWDLMEVTDRPLTIIYPAGKNLAPNLLHNDGSVGIRITKDKFCKTLINRLNKPLVSTSANISGEPAPSNFKEIPDVIRSGVDYIIKWRQDEMTKGMPSAIIKLGTKGEIKIIRK